MHNLGLSSSHPHGNCRQTRCDAIAQGLSGQAGPALGLPEGGRASWTSKDEVLLVYLYACVSVSSRARRDWEAL